MILNGTAVGTVRVNGILGMIRLTGKAQNIRRETARGYDAITDSFFGAAAHIPIIAPEKMIREEKSSRNWSFRAGAGGFSSKPSAKDLNAEGSR